jgi:transcriptional regulator with XRE-family HTH domain
MTFGESITQIRHNLKWSQSELTKKIGTSGPIIGRYAREEIKPSIDVTVKIADALEVSTDYLLGKSEKMTFNKELAQRIEDIENFSPDKKEHVYTFIDMAIRDDKTQKVFNRK